jgi:hypothetical protein
MQQKSCGRRQKKALQVADLERRLYSMVADLQLGLTDSRPAEEGKRRPNQ